MTSQDTVCHTSQPTILGMEKKKFQSPPPVPSSMTPPPSSQTVHFGPPIARTPTPTLTHLSSPPPTVQAATSQNDFEPVAQPYDVDQIANASMEELRSMLAETIVAYREARTTAAHQTLQLSLLQIESSEAMKRMQVELEMAQKEVEVLQMLRFNTSGLNPALISPALATEQTLGDMRSRCYLLELENANLTERYHSATTLMLEREGMMAEENERLRQRIRENRRHLNIIRSSSDGSLLPLLDTPHLTSTYQQRNGNSTSKTHEDAAFAALLQATDQVLSQEAATTPSTPVPRLLNQVRQGGGGHSRGAQSLSSLPSTPHHARSAPNHPYYAGPRTAHPQSPPQAVMSTSSHSVRPQRESRDSTISAEDQETHLLEEEYSTEEDEQHEAQILDSQASQEAASLLRKSALRATKALNAASAYSSGVARSSGLLQTKLYSPVKKPRAVTSDGDVKRKLFDSVTGSAERSAKKAKISESIGLGIGLGIT